MSGSRGGLFLALAERLLKICPGWCFGKTIVMKDKYRSRYGQRNWDTLIHKIRLRTAKAYLVNTIIFLLLISIIIIGFRGEKTIINEIPRPEYGQEDQREKIKAKVTYEDALIEKEIKIKIPAKDLTEEEKHELLLAYQERLPTLILGKNDSLDHVTYDLILPEKDDETNILAEWVSDSPEILSGKGKLDYVAAKKGGSATLTAVLSIDEVTEVVSIFVKIPPQEGKDYSGALESRLSQEVKRLQEGIAAKKSLILPDKLGNEIYVQWSIEKQSPMSAIICLFLFGYLIIFFKRYDGLERQFKAGKDAMVRDFPDFIDKLVLLLNAGLVTDSALRKIAVDYERFRDVAEKKPLYEGLWEMEKRIAETNAPLIKELREYAQRSGVRELIRFATIVEDNLNKGSTLAEKLEGEGVLLRLGKKRRAEERGRLAETKLTFPLMLLLLCLILITIAPVMLEI